MIIIGIDPGQKGALCGLIRDEIIFHDMPLHTEKKKAAGGAEKTVRRVDGIALGRILRQWVRMDFQAHVIIEHLWGFASSKRGKKGTNTSGDFVSARDYGRILGVIESQEISHTYVAPQTWQRGVDKIGADKDASIQRALELYPHADLVRTNGRVQHDGRAEALLLAHWGKEVLFGGKDESTIRFLYEHY